MTIFSHIGMQIVDFTVEMDFLISMGLKSNMDWITIIDSRLGVMIIVVLDHINPRTKLSS